MSDRHERARAEAERLMNDFYDTWGHTGTTEEVEWEKGFHSGFDGGVERAARAIHASHDRGSHFEAEDHAVQDEYRAMARAALTAAIGGNDE